MMRFTRQRTIGIIAVIVGIGIILLVLLRLSIPDPLTKESLISLSEFMTQLFVGLTLLCVAGAYWGFKPDVEKYLQKLHHGIEERDHMVELNDIIFKRLATIIIRTDRSDNYGLYVKKDITQNSPRLLYLGHVRTDLDVISLDKLPKVYYDWALKHLEHKKYSNTILKPYNQLQECIGKYNKIEITYREKLEKQIEKTVNESFLGCSIYEKIIRKRLENEIWTENPDDRFHDLIIDRISQHDAIMPRGYPTEHPYIICKTITDEQLEQFKTILNGIMTSEEFFNTSNEQNELFKKIESGIIELGSKFQRMSVELGAKGSTLEGKCELCSTF